MIDKVMLKDHLELSHGITPEVYSDHSPEYLHERDHEMFDPFYGTATVRLEHIHSNAVEPVV